MYPLNKSEKIVSITPNTFLELKYLSIEDIQEKTELGEYIPARIYFYVPVFKSFKEMVERYGEEVIMACFQYDLMQRIRDKARNNLPFGANKEQLIENLKECIAKGEILALTQTESLNFIPGVSSTSVDTVLNRAKELEKAGDKEGAKRLTEKAKKMLNVVSSQLEEIDKALEEIEL